MKRYTGIIAVVLTLMLCVSCEYISDLNKEVALTDGLVAYWPVNESYESATSYGKTIKDYSGNNNLIAYAQGGGPTSVSFVQGKFSTAISFDGSNDYVQVNSNPLKNSNTFTISFWYYPRGNASKNALFCSAFNIYVDGPYFSFSISGTSVYTNTIVQNQWSYITITYDKNSILLYVNGLLTNQTAYTANLSLFTSIQFGQDGNNTGFYYGYLDEIRIYNRALSGDEIKKLMEVGMD